MIIFPSESKKYNQSKVDECYVIYLKDIDEYLPNLCLNVLGEVESTQIENLNDILFVILIFNKRYWII
jgi:hypothetical protein